METKVKARPFLKWSGGKTQLLPELLKRVPATYGTYYEPFVGAGALFFALQPEKAVLGDMNGDLILTWNVIKYWHEKLIEELKRPEFANTSEAFYKIRSWSLAGGGCCGGTSDRIENHVWAARMIYLNKTCFNGLYRVNKSGQFNAPYGKYANPTICDETNLRAVHEALKNVSLQQSDFRSSIVAVEGDFVYLDPPYVPLSKTSNFTAYTSGGFGLAEHTALRDLALDLKYHGVHVLLSNSAAPLVEDLYGKDFKLEPVAARRSINSVGTSRGTVKEYLIS